MGEDPILVFIDESGDENTQIEKVGTTRFFSCLSVFVEGSKIDSLRRQIVEIERLANGGGLLKSSQVGGNWPRRLKVLRKLAELDFTYSALCIDKAQLYQHGGYQYKRSFRKSTISMLYERFCSTGNSYKVVIDQHGGEEFQKSFDTYIKSFFRRNLFQSVESEFGDDSTEPLLRVADFLSGTWRIIVETRPRVEITREVRALFTRHELSVDIWPVTALPSSEVPRDSALDMKIREFSLRRASEFVDSVADDAPEIDRYRAHFLKRLLFEAWINPEGDSITSTKLLMKSLEATFSKKRNLQTVRRDVVAYLRDKGILLAGRSNGMKLVINAADFDAFLDHFSSEIVPMIRRVARGREIIKMLTNGAYDPLSQPKYDQLRTAVHAVVDTGLFGPPDVL